MPKLEIRGALRLPIGPVLRRWRKGAGLSQAQLEDRCGWSSRGRVCKYESGRISMPLEHLIDVAESLDVDVMDILRDVVRKAG